MTVVSNFPQAFEQIQAPSVAQAQTVNEDNLSSDGLEPLPPVQEVPLHFQRTNEPNRRIVGAPKQYAKVLFNFLGCRGTGYWTMESILAGLIPDKVLVTFTPEEFS